MGRFKKVDGIPTVAMPSVPRATLARGAVGCGKTQLLIDKVRELVMDGAPAASVLVLCATPDAAHALAARLNAPDVRVCSAYELALELLARADACAMFGHDPRVLLPYEEDVLFEDLKVSGLEIDRLEGMFSFFKRSMTEISDDHPDFLVDDDEQAVMGLLRRGLELRGAYLKEQVCANAARYLAFGKGALPRFEHVLVDDYQLLCRASQVMAGLLATESIFVAADPIATDRVFEPYPHVAGIAEFLTANPHAQVVELNGFQGRQAVGRAVNALRREAGLEECGLVCDENADEGDALAVSVLENPSAELERAAQTIVGAIEQGVSPDDMYVVSPDRRWSEGLARLLAKSGVPSSLACDWAHLASSGAITSADPAYLRAVTALLLAGDENDSVAWRSWCAFDSPLAASDVFAAIGDYATTHGISLHHALIDLLDREDEARSLASHGDVQGVIDACRAGIDLLDSMKGLERDALLRTLADKLYGAEAPVPEQLQLLCGGTSPSADARAIRECILQRASMPGWEQLAFADGEDVQAVGSAWNASPLTGSVRIGSMNRMCGLSPSMVVFIGFVNGFFPRHGFFDETVTPPGKVEAAHAADARLLCTAVGKARQRLVFTAFTQLPCADAERFHLKIDRIALVRRVKTARVSPSIFCEVL